MNEPIKESNKKWKERLLSSSMPLEYEVAKILVSNNFIIDFDYSYKRYDELEKEFSIDIKADGFHPFNIKSKINFQLDLLVECKYRNPNISWLFINDIALDDFTKSSSKGALKVFDEFSNINAGVKPGMGFFCETCVKGMEINLHSGDVHESDLKHGINQLVYAMPFVLKDRIEQFLMESEEDVVPFIICPILITTAEIRILNRDFTIDDCKKANSLDDISEVVPFLIYYSECPPSVGQHCKAIFNDFPDKYVREGYEYYKNLRRVKFTKQGKFDHERIYNRPDDLIHGLSQGFGTDLFSETLICNFEHFPTLLEEIKSNINFIRKGFKKIKP